MIGRWQRKRIAGFTLTEASVVLGAIGIVLASIWTTAGMVIQNQKTSQFSQQLTTLVTNVSKMYEGKSSFTSSTSESEQFEQTLIAAGAVPEGMINRATTPPTFFSTFGRVSISPVSGTKFMVFQGSAVLPVQACIGMMRAVQNISPEISSLWFSGYITKVPCTRTDNSPAELAYCPPAEATESDSLAGMQIEAITGDAARINSRTPLSTITAYCENQNREGVQAGFEAMFQ